MNEKIFRKVSIDRLSSPEQLDQMITVTSAMSWLILVAVGCILATVIIWSFTGSLDTNVTANGILVKSGGIIEINSKEEGLISDIKVLPGDFVNKGDIIARLDHSELVDEITDLINEHNLLVKNNTEDEKALTLEKKIDERKKKLQSSSIIISNETGRVVEVKPQVGDSVTPGTVIINLVKEGEGVKDLIALLYVPVESGKKLVSGMEVRISPSTVQKEEYGYLMGRIVSVSEYPVSVHTVTQEIGSSEMATTFVGETASLQVTIDLVNDSETVSGYRWSTPSGPPIKIANETACSASVIVEQQKPIEMVIPQISNLLRE